jgi:hypothetical protein
MSTNVEKMILLSMKLSDMTRNGEIKWLLENEESISIFQMASQLRIPSTLRDRFVGYGRQNSSMLYTYKTEIKEKTFCLVGVDYMGITDVELHIFNKQKTLEFVSNSPSFQSLFRLVRQRQYSREIYQFIDEFIQDIESEPVTT